MPKLRPVFGGRFGRREAAALAEALDILTNPSALLAMAVLQEHGPMLNTQLQVRLGVSQSTTSHCLARLARAGLVTRHRRTFDGGGPRTGVVNQFSEDGYDQLVGLLYPGGAR